jgi:hypothetical protein
VNDILNAQLCAVCNVAKDKSFFRLKGRPAFKIQKVLHEVCTPCRKIQNRRNFLKRNPERIRETKRRSKREARRAVMEFYSPSGVKCACCGERHYSFLTLDHVNGGGCKERDALGSRYWSYLRRNKPEGYQVLCMNCNWAKGHEGLCPHQKPRDEDEAGS